MASLLAKKLGWTCAEAAHFACIELLAARTGSIGAV
jgi:hypothetical protein